MVNVPKSHERFWTIPFFLGFNYMFYKKDYATAARYLEEASKHPKRRGTCHFWLPDFIQIAGDPEEPPSVPPSSQIIPQCDPGGE